MTGTGKHCYTISDGQEELQHENGAWDASGENAASLLMGTAEAPCALRNGASVVQMTVSGWHTNRRRGCLKERFESVSYFFGAFSTEMARASV
jgi:hypothetical protein